MGVTFWKTSSFVTYLEPGLCQSKEGRVSIRIGKTSKKKTVKE